MKDTNSLKELEQLVRTLRGPDGCPWDREQTASDLKSYLVSEVYEVLEAIDLGDSTKIKEESGDVLFLIVFLVDIFREKDDFTIDEVIGAVRDKMIRRHPHVFGNTRVNNTDEIKLNWRKMKEREGKPATGESILDGVPDFLPALFQAQRLTQKAARVGFDWQTPSQIISKIEEELDELKQSLDENEHNAIEDELGDLFFSLVNLGRFLKMDSEQALRKTNKKFTRRFRYMENSFRHAGRDINQASLEEMDAWWEKAKARER